MTDEEYGRAFAALVGARYDLKIWRNLPEPVEHELSHDWDWWDTEPQACVALGKAVREIHRLVPLLPGGV